MFVRMFDLTSGNLSAVVNYQGISKNVMAVGCQVAFLLVFVRGVVLVRSAESIQHTFNFLN
jgi:hypothetical protein